MQNTHPEIVQFFTLMMNAPEKESSDLYGYLYAKDTLSAMGINHEPDTCTGASISRFTIWSARRFPATTAFLFGHFYNAYAHSNISLLSEFLVEAYLERKIHHDYQVSSIAEMLSLTSKPRFENNNCGNRNYANNLLVLSGMAMASLDDVVLEDEARRNELRGLLQKSFDDLASRSSMEDFMNISANLSQWKDSFVTKSIEQLALLFEERSKNKMVWANDNGALYLIRNYLAISLENNNEYGLDRTLSVILKTVLNSFQLPDSEWINALRSRSVIKHMQIDNMRSDLSIIHSLLIDHGVNKNKIRSAFTAIAKPVLQTVFNIKAKPLYNQYEQSLIRELIVNVDVPVVLDSLKPGARKIFVDYIIRNHPEYAENLKPKERALLLESTLGI